MVFVNTSTRKRAGDAGTPSPDEDAAPVATIAATTSIAINVRRALMRAR